MRVYLSGPISGIDRKDAFKTFSEYADMWREEGHDVVNPMDNTENEGQEWSFCVKNDIRSMLDCDAVALLPGWERSKGALLEYRVARELNFRLFDAKTMKPIFLDLPEPFYDTVLDEAKSVVDGPRQKDYDHPFDNHERIAAMWSIQLGPKLKEPITAEEAGLCLIGLKLARAIKKITRDTLTDISGYSYCIELMQKEREKRSHEEI